MNKYSVGNYYDGKIWIRRIVQPYCDVCKNVYEIECEPAYPIHLIFKSMRRNGWTLGKKCICPECNRTKKERDRIKGM